MQWKPLGEPGSGGYLTGVQISPHDSNLVILSGDMLGVGYSLDRGATWLTSMSPASEVADITFHPTDPQVIWVGSMSGPLLSTDAGRTFTLQREGMPPVSPSHFSVPIEVVRFDPGNADRLLAFGGSSRRWESPGKPLWGVVWESLDCGKTWSKLTTLTAQGNSSREDVEGLNIIGAAFSPADPNRLYASLNEGGVLTSTDGGRSWQPRNNGLPHAKVNRIALHPQDADVLYVALDNHKPDDAKRYSPGGIYKTTDGGMNWKPVTQGLTQVSTDDPNLSSRYTLISLGPNDPDTLLTADTSWNAGIVYRSRNGGESWEPVATKGNIGRVDESGARQNVFRPDVAMPAGLGMSVGGFDPHNAEVAILASIETVLRTNDGGETWQDVSATRVEGGRWRGTGYAGWCAMDFVFAPDAPDDSVFTALDAAKLWRSTDELQSWKYHGGESNPWGGGVQAVYAGPWIYFTSGQHGQMHGIYRVDRVTGESTRFQGKKHGLPDMPGQGDAMGVYAHSSNPDTVYAAVCGALLWSKDAGQSWQELLPDLGIHWVAGDPRDPKLLYASSNDGVLRSTDGENFESIGGPRPATSGRLRVDGEGRVFIASWRETGSGLWRWTEATGWRRLFDDNFTHDVAVDPHNPRRIILGTTDHPYHDLTHATGVWVSTDDGETWTTANDGLAMHRVQSVTFDPHRTGRVVLGTLGRGYFVADWPADHAPPGEKRSYVHTDADGEFAKSSSNALP